ncbi:MAG TPA: hypothetical protein DIW37_08375 [Chryseobacterium sp.]|nr:hypothetical protein [Chryseobacterium sp.]
MKHFSITLLIFLTTFSFAQIPNKLTASNKAYSISKFWQEVNYNLFFSTKGVYPAFQSNRELLDFKWIKVINFFYLYLVVN